jgi:hypothetical protein
MHSTKNLSIGKYISSRGRKLSCAKFGGEFNFKLFFKADIGSKLVRSLYVFAGKIAASGVTPKLKNASVSIKTIIRLLSILSGARVCQ